MSTRQTNQSAKSAKRTPKGMYRISPDRIESYLKLFRAQEGLCFYCRQPMIMPWPGLYRLPVPDKQITREHLIVRKKRPKGARSPIVGACKACNHDRGGRPSWAAYLCSKQDWGPK
ncbi:MAG: hypothetical protein K0U74_12125 [Alphaproteobacteria bacterium]|nr:hypothetical protein [Alphaproteobacteria bacterium]